jgi:hypothetical protein
MCQVNVIMLAEVQAELFEIDLTKSAHGLSIPVKSCKAVFFCLTLENDTHLSRSILSLSAER